MAHVGEILEQPLTGERLTFLETAATTGGDFLKISMEMAHGGHRLMWPRAEERLAAAASRSLTASTVGRRRDPVMVSARRWPRLG